MMWELGTLTYTIHDGKVWVRSQVADWSRSRFTVEAFNKALKNGNLHFKEIVETLENE